MNPCGRTTPHAEHTFTMDSTDRDGVRTVTTYHCLGNPTISAVEVSRVTIPLDFDVTSIGVARPAEHLLHFAPNDGMGNGGDWRLECVHDPDDPKWLTIVGGVVLGQCWTIDWWDNDGYEAIHGSWPEDPVFPLPVDCIWADADCLEVRPWKP